MTIKQLNTKEEMLANLSLLNEVYPSLTFEEYSNELDMMLSNNYSQLAVYEGNECVGLTGLWFGSKLWCGKYIELDNVVVAEKHRSKGIGNLIFEKANELAIEFGATMLALDSYTTNFKAHKFFYNEGYAPKGFHFVKLLDKSKVR